MVIVILFAQIYIKNYQDDKCVKLVYCSFRYGLMCSVHMGPVKSGSMWGFTVIHCHFSLL